VERDFNGKKKLACPSCTFVHWDNPREVAVVLVPAPDRSGRLLLIKRLIAPRIGCFALPGGFVDKGEGPEEAAIREVFEETGIIVKIERHLRSVPIPQANQILTFYLATAIGGTLTNSYETDAVDYYSPEALPGEIAFPTHLEAIQTWAKQGNNA
jgi:ADP-ribose pyrophosphatase YjhB (NUDIX family)